MSIPSSTTREAEDKFKHATLGTGSRVSSSNAMKCLVLNCQSICNKHTEVLEYASDSKAEVAWLSETWLKTRKNDVTAAAKDFGFILKHTIRKNRAKTTGGGVGLLIKNTLETKQVKMKQFQTFEHHALKVNMEGNEWVTLVSIYRLDYEPIDLFFTEFTQLLERTITEKCVIAGDINIHCEKEEDQHAVQLNNLLSTYNLTQIIHGPTHKKGHTLDVVIVRLEDTEISGVEVTDTGHSDHFMIGFSMECSVVRSYYKTIKFRKKVDNVAFRDRLLELVGTMHISDNFGESIMEYNRNMSALVDELGPKVTKTVKIVDSAPWFDDEYRKSRRERRKAERKSKKSGKQEDIDAFKELRKRATTMAKEKKQQHYIEKIQNSSNKPKMLFKVVKSLMDSEQSNSLPTSTSDKKLANDFQQYFKDKITKIRESFCSDEAQQIHHLPGNVQEFSSFELVTVEEIRTIIKKYGISCSPEDPIPTSILNEHMEALLPYWKELVNLSLETGSMDCVKSAAITSLLKEADEALDPEIFKNYRPVSNLVFLSKLIERCVAPRLKEHMKTNKLESPNAFGYKDGHSTELLLVKVVDGLLTAFDKKHATVLLLLDLSAAFDTVDQRKLLKILYHEIGMRGTVYKWFESFITGRTQRVKVNNDYSEEIELLFGLAQGSVLGPPLFNIYVRSLYPYIQALRYAIEGFADDHQLFKSFLPIFQTEVLGHGINKCLSAISTWMNEYFLKLNKTKTKILVLGPPSVLSSIVIQGAFVGDDCIRFVSSAKNLGVWLDEHLDFATHIRKVVSGTFMVIRAISKIKSFLPYEHLSTVVCSLVLSRLDYCNALYYNLHKSQLALLQSAQNAAIRLIRGGHKYDRVSLSPIYEELHWLRIEDRITFKICLIVHKCVWGMGPESYADMITVSNPRTLKLTEKRFCTEYGRRAFSCAGPKLWNCLPHFIRAQENTEVFKKQLKSLLMTEAEEFYRQVTMR